MSKNAAFWSLEPEPAFAETLQACKQQVRDLAGPQRYLDDPPHLTLYKACLQEDTDLHGLLTTCAARIPQPRVRITGWHVFEDDPLTGGHTLVCAIHEEDKRKLREVQQTVLETFAPLRASAHTRALYADGLAHLAPHQVECIEKWGFPFIGDEWEPHFSVASIPPACWEVVWRKLGPVPPERTITCPELRLYALEDETPRLLHACKIA